MVQFADQRIHLAQRQRRLLGLVLKVDPHEAQIRQTGLQRQSTGSLQRSRSVFLGLRQDAQDPSHTVFAGAAVDLGAQRTDVLPSVTSAREKLQRRRWRSPRLVFWRRLPVAAFLDGIFALELVRRWMNQAHAPVIPLHGDQAPEQFGRRAVVRARDFEAPVEMYGPGAVLVVAKRLHGQDAQLRLSSAYMALT